MTARLFDRLAFLLRADAHGVIDSLEERSLLLEQCLREADAELGRKRAHLEALRQEAKRLGDDRARHDAEIRALDEDVALALKGGKDELARFAVRRLLRRRLMVQAVGERLQEVGEESRTLAERVAAQEVQLESLRRRVRAERARGDAGPPFDDDPGADVADEAVEIELLRRRAAEGGQP